MKVLDKLASALGRRDEQPNIELAEYIAAHDDKTAVEQLVAALDMKKDLANDSIKALYEVGERKPELIAPYLEKFVSLLSHKNNRLQWGSMTALNSITSVKPKEIYSNLSAIMNAADSDSVITRDKTAQLLAQLAAIPAYNEEILSLYHELLLTSPVNQFPTYAEGIAPYIPDSRKEEFSNIIHTRMDDLNTDAKRQRMVKLLKKLNG